jgi:allophanate hydrolase subunit 2
MRHPQGEGAKLADGGELVSRGRGTELLDDIVLTMHKQSVPQIRAVTPQMPPQFVPYVYCTQLIQLSKGHQYNVLERLSVGGIFHFLYQTDAEEERQGIRLSARRRSGEVSPRGRT